jgi:ATP-dependent DNA helicase RecG
MNSRELSALLTELRSRSGETEWIEFKQNNADPQEIGEYLSALSNASRIRRRR